MFTRMQHALVDNAREQASFGESQTDTSSDKLRIAGMEVMTSLQSRA